MSADERVRQAIGEAFSGAVLVRRAGETLLDRGYGFADRDRALPATPATVFQIASVSKQFTAAAVVALSERGELSLDDALARWFPACPAQWAPITVHQLLTNTSGIGHWADYPEIDLYRRTPPDELVATFFERPLRFAPGSRWSYSSPGFVLLARIVEATVGASYHAFLTRELFEPLRLERTSVGSGRGDVRAQGYSAGERVPSFELETVAMGAGDVWSTTHDLARWNEAIASGSLPGGESIVALTTPHARVSPNAEYGYGVFVGSLSGRDAVYHAGDNRGFRAFNAWLPHDETSVVVLTNNDQVDVEAIAPRLIAAALQ
jgi:CubicO group peptidase (beta-lactamase class C family)